MADFNRKKFLEAILNISATSGLGKLPPAQKPTTPSFAHYMAAKTYGSSDVTDAAILAAQSGQQSDAESVGDTGERNPGALSKVFDYLMAPMHEVQNFALNFTDSSLDTSEKIVNGLKDYYSMGAHLLQPVAEVAAIPGVKVPWEPESLSKYINERNTHYHGSKKPTEKIILEDRMNFPKNHPVWEAIAGLGLDIFTDPLTYTGIGALTKVKNVKEAAEVIDEAAKAKSIFKPVVFPDTALPKSNKFAHMEAAGAEQVKNLPGEAHAVSRAHQVEIYRDLIANVTARKVPEKVRLVKGAEDALEAKGFTFPEGKLSQYLHFVKDTKPKALEQFVFGKPERTLKLDLTLEEKAKAVEPGVSEAIDALAKGAAAHVYRIPEVEGSGFVKMATKAAEDIRKSFGKTVGKRKIAAVMNPANQAKLYETILNKVHDQDTALQMLKTAESHLTKQGLQGQHWDGSGMKLSAAIEELGPTPTPEEVGAVVKAFKQGSHNFVKDPVAKAAITKAIARRKLETGAMAQGIVEKFNEAAKAMERSVSYQKYLEWKHGDAALRSRYAAGLAGATPEEAQRIVDLVKNQVNTEGLELMEPMKVLETIGKRYVESVLNGTADTKLIRKINKALQETVGETPAMQRSDFFAKSAFTTFMMRHTTWYGRGDMIHFAREAYSAIETNAKMRSTWLNNIARDFSKEDVLVAFKHSQGHWHNVEVALAEKGVTTPIIDERLLGLSKAFSDYFENLMASSRTINNVDALKGSVAVRSGAMMDDVNRELRVLNNKAFQFVNKSRTGKNVAGNPAGHGLGYEGWNWQLSWENLDPSKLGQDPLHFMYDLDLAMNRATTEYAMIDDFAMRFGRHVDEIPTKDLPGYRQYSHHRIDKSYRFPNEVANEFNRLVKDMERGNWMPTDAFMRQYVKYQRLWKTGVTQYNPAFHWHNLLGDTTLMWLAGHNNPKYFRYAAKMIHSNRARYKEALDDPDLSVLQGLIDKDHYGVAQSKDTDVILDKYGANLTSAELYGEMAQRGQLLDAHRAVDVIGDPLFAEAAGRNPNALRQFAEKPLGGHAHNLVMKTTEIREHYVRIAHFTSAVDKQLTPKIAKQLNRIMEDDRILNKVAARREVLKPIYENASREVRKWHPDGRDLSYWDQKYARQIMPFYSWQRKIIPLMVESMLVRPAKLTAYPKVNFAIQNALGIPAPAVADPFPTDQLFPDWMRNIGIGPIGDPQSDNAVAAWWGKLGNNQLVPGLGEVGYTMVAPQGAIPFNDTVIQYGQGATTLQDSAQSSSSLLTPFFNIPKEFFSDSTWTGAPISKDEGGAGYANWALSQTPVVGNFNRVLDVGGKHQEDAEHQRFDKEAIINILTALGVRGTGQYMKSAQFDADKAGIGLSQ